MSIAAAYAPLRNLSLDVVLGALVSGHMVAWMMAYPMPVIWWISLPIAVWVIYTSDHLLDAYRLQGQAHTQRHLFHHRYFRAIGVVWLILLLSCLSWIALLVPRPMLYLALVMGVIVLIHLGLVRWVGDRVGWFFHKELGVALIYATGVWGGPFVLCPQGITPPLILMFAQFFLLALINLLFFSMYEAESDQMDGHTSFARFLGPRRSRIVIACLGTLVIGIGGYLFYSGLPFRYLAGELILGSMLGILLLVTFLPGYFSRHDRYRYWGDGVFLLPVLVVFL